MSLIQSWDETSSRWQKIVVLTGGVNVVGHDQHSINIDVISLLLLEPNFQQCSLSALIVEQVESEVLGGDTGEHDLVGLLCGHHGDEGRQSLSADVAAAAGEVLWSIDQINPSVGPRVGQHSNGAQPPDLCISVHGLNYHKSVVNVITGVGSPDIIPHAGVVSVKTHIRHLVCILYLLAIRGGDHGLGNSVVSEASHRVTLPLKCRVRNNCSSLSILIEGAIIVIDDQLLEA